MIFLGADVTHPPVGDNRKPSIAAVVGSQDAHPSRFLSSALIGCCSKKLATQKIAAQNISYSKNWLLKKLAGKNWLLTNILSRYAATVRVQQHRQEIIQDLSAMVRILML